MITQEGRKKRIKMAFIKKYKYSIRLRLYFKSAPFRTGWLIDQEEKALDTSTSCLF